MFQHADLGFGERWLLEAGASPDVLPTLTAAATARARRYPAPIHRLYLVLHWLMQWVAPALILGQFCRASRLSADDFDALLVRCRGHRLALVRVLTVLVQSPWMEALNEESPPPERPHPLDGTLRHPQEVNEVYDVAIIGSGAGGAPVAWALASRGYRVVVIEKGGVVRPDTAAKIVEKHYVSQGVVGSVEEGVALVMAGTSVGGTTSINSGTSLWPLNECLQRWDERWGTRLGQGELEPYLQRVHDEIGITTPSTDLLSASSRIVLKGFAALGRDGVYVLPRNAPHCKGAGRCCFACPNHAKRSTDHTFLPGAVRAGATLCAEARVTGISEDDSGVTLMVASDRGEVSVRARHLVISAGGLFTPGLLRRNRLGTMRGEAGRYFKMHPATKVLAYFPGLCHGPGGVPQGVGYRPPELPRVTMEGIHTPKSVLGPLLTTAGRRYHWWMDRHDQLASFGLMQRDRSTGRVFEVMDLPQLRYRLHEEDARDIAAGLTIIAEAFFAAGAERVLLPFSGFDNELRSPRDLERLRRAQVTPDMIAVSGFHPQGTAGMGRVVDGDLRLLGARHISVCDASVMPDSPGVNPQVTIMALSLRLADRLAAELPRS